MDTIKDGTGKGYSLQIDSKNRMRGYVVIEEEAAYINRVEKEMYSGQWNGAIIADTANNWIVYLKNTSVKDLIINKVKHRASGSNGTISFWCNVDGNPTSGSYTVLTPNNRNAGSNNEADCIYYKGSEIEGLSGGRQIGSIYGKDGEEFEYAEPCSGFIIPPNSNFVIKASDTDTYHYGGLAFYFRDAEK